MGEEINALKGREYWNNAEVYQDFVDRFEIETILHRLQDLFIFRFGTHAQISFRFGGAMFFTVHLDKALI